MHFISTSAGRQLSHGRHRIFRPRNACEFEAGGHNRANHAASQDRVAEAQAAEQAQQSCQYQRHPVPALQFQEEWDHQSAGNNAQPKNGRNGAREDASGRDLDSTVRRHCKEDNQDEYFKRLDNQSILANRSLGVFTPNPSRPISRLPDSLKTGDEEQNPGEGPYATKRWAGCTPAEVPYRPL